VRPNSATGWRAPFSLQSDDDPEQPERAHGYD
jgi:hypothetical protein